VERDPLEAHRAGGPEAALEEPPRIGLGGDQRGVREEELVHEPSGEELPGERGAAFAQEEADAAFRESGARRLLLTHRPAERPLENGYEQVYDGFELEL